MESAIIQISHNRNVRLQKIEEKQQQSLTKNQTRYFIYEVDDNKWQNVNPDGEPEYDLETINQEKALLPIGILSVDNSSNTFTFEGDLTITKDDQAKIFTAVTSEAK